MIAIGKLAWVVSQKKDNLWAKWVSEVSVKDTSWGNYVATNNASWVWKTVCTAKNELNIKLNGDIVVLEILSSALENITILLEGMKSKYSGAGVFGTNSLNPSTE